ncbi:MAG: hypothetical protein L3J82_01740 [Planctomycetes bacterium]|nr:hypothetical protein [Planctomycetota bacterium]
MSQIKTLTGGLIVIMLGLAGGTGYLIYERINTEVANTEKVTKQEVNELKTEVKSNASSLKLLKTTVKINTKRIASAETKIQNGKNERDILKEVDKELRKDSEANKAEIEENVSRIGELDSQIESQTKKIAEFQSELDNAKDQLSKLGTQVEANSKKYNELEKRIDEDKEASDEENRKLKDQLRTQAEEIKKIKELLGIEDTPPKP